MCRCVTCDPILWAFCDSGTNCAQNIRPLLQVTYPLTERAGRPTGANTLSVQMGHCPRWAKCLLHFGGETREGWRFLAAVTQQILSL